MSKPRAVLLLLDSLRKGPAARVLVEPAQPRGFTLSTPGAAFRFTFVMSGSLNPELVYGTSGSEFIFKGPAALRTGKVLLTEARFPALFKIAEDGRLAWVAGPAVFQDIHNHNQAGPERGSLSRIAEVGHTP